MERAASSTLWLSRFSSIVLLITYAAFLAYQLKTHAHLYDDDNRSAQQTDDTGRSPALAQRSLEEQREADEDDVPVLGFWGAIGALHDCVAHNRIPI